MSKCDIIIPVWNQLDVTRECVTSIMAHTAYPYRLIIIDNASDVPTAQYLDSLKAEKNLDLVLIRNPKNLGFVKAVNQGIKASGAPYLCIMNNDTIATAGWLNELVDVIEANRNMGLINPSSNTSGQYPEDKSIDDYAETLKPLKGQVQELYTCRGFCMLVRKEVIERVGLLDEIYHIGYYDDTDYCKRAQRLGYRTARAKASYVYHKENVSFKTLDNNKELFDSNERIFFSRWGRHVRVAYFLDSAKSADKVDRIATDVARSGHQITVFIKKGLPWPVVLDHFDIRRVDVNPFLYGCIAVYKLLKRKKKKKLEILLTDNEFFGKLLKLIGSRHGADVMIGADRQDVLKLLDERSKIF